ncbi:GNAT family N-acetyltransferase [Nocardioides bruguierae]|uniref:GNAT family N-acetyltransferase n=1 Tax=Nocardioides bruguierae TaxID=2945102 RepID=A0A9X2IES6_9ACTN|nr:GNAT family N-acetyltransferase [Nocardioides bruguierae]MCL8023973.1 GNAT family N-acetyltransferase [Nocardioides bruguierae]MCM0620363.1 GNAT family N-acetyltransferase [Nocardioides bruguierae]
MAETPDTLVAGDRTFRVRRARRDDVPAVVALLRADPVSATREQAPDEAYLRAFEEVDADPRHLLAVVVGDDDRPVATAQLMLLPHLSRGGATRLQVEAVQVGSQARGTGLGTALMEWAHAWGRAHGATLVQLTSDVTRTDAHRFYERLGYTRSHAGFKRPL